MKKPPRRLAEKYMHKRWHIVPKYSGGKRVCYYVWRFGLIPGLSLCAPGVPLDGLNREGREKLICGAFFDEIAHKEGMGLHGNA